MSAAAMFLIPEAVKDANRQPGNTVGTSALPAAGGAGSGPPRASAAVPRPTRTAAERAAPGTARTLRDGPVSMKVNGFWSWSLLDRRTGAITGSPNLNARSDTASMIKTWIAADYLRRAAEKGQKVPAAVLGELTLMIRDSDNESASEYHRINGGSASINRMIKICGLTESRPVEAGSWSTTEVSARDGARLGLCISDGRAAGAQWTKWVLDEMRRVRGVGRFGIISAFAPDVAPNIAIKNGWIYRNADDTYHIACLAVTDEWSLTVLIRYRNSLGHNYGANICKQVAVQLGSTT
jgi:hypothetical protein